MGRIIEKVQRAVRRGHLGRKRQLLILCASLILSAAGACSPFHDSLAPTANAVAKSLGSLAGSSAFGSGVGQSIGGSLGGSLAKTTSTRLLTPTADSKEPLDPSVARILENEKTGSTSVLLDQVSKRTTRITILSTWEDGVRPCRDYRIQQSSGTSVRTACRSERGWMRI